MREKNKLFNSNEFSERSLLFSGLILFQHSFVFVHVGGASESAVIFCGVSGAVPPTGLSDPGGAFGKTKSKVSVMTKCGQAFCVLRLCPLPCD